MRKIFCTFIAAVLAVSLLSGCSGNEEPSETGSDETAGATEKEPGSSETAPSSVTGSETDTITDSESLTETETEKPDTQTSDGVTSDTTTSGIRETEPVETDPEQPVSVPASFTLKTVKIQDTELFRGKNAENTRKFYPNTTQLIEDIAQAYRTFFQEIYAAGCRTIQLDDCTWGMIVDSDYWKAKVGNGFTLEQEALQYLKVNNLAIEGKPEGLTINTHVCRGNYHSCYATKGAYDAVAPYLFAHEDVDTFYLEYDDERSGGFEPLKYVADGKKVVLGLVTSKSPVLEDKATVIARIHEAAKYISLNRLSLSPQCGFASCEIGNKLTDAEQWAKIDLVREISEEVWGSSSFFDAE